MSNIPDNSSQPAPDERRESFRCPVIGSRCRGRLRIGRREIAVRILDESAGGFAVESDSEPGCHIGDSLLLEVESAWSQVQVVNMQHLEHAGEVLESADPPRPVRLNLLRVREVDEYEVNPRAHRVHVWSLLRSGLRPLVPLGRSCKSGGAMIVAIIAAGIVIVWVLENTVPLTEAIQRGAHDAASRPPIGDPTFVPDQNPPKSRPPRKPKPARPSPPVEAKTAETTKSKKPASAPPPAVPKPKVEVPPKAARLAHPKFLLKPEVARLLTLRREQRDQLRQLHAEHLAASADAPSPDGNMLQETENRLVRLSHKSLEILTNEQRSLLMKLHAAMESSQNSESRDQPSTESDGETVPSDEPPAKPAQEPS